MVANRAGLFSLMLSLVTLGDVFQFDLRPPLSYQSWFSLAFKRYGAKFLEFVMVAPVFASSELPTSSCKQADSKPVESAHQGFCLVLHFREKCTHP